jgi:hypothetical protein
VEKTHVIEEIEGSDATGNDKTSSDEATSSEEPSQMLDHQ